MGEYGFIAAIAGVLVAGAMSPGPSFFVVAQNALSRSRADGLLTAVGTALGVALFALLAGLGVVTLLHETPLLYFVLKLAGGLYLLWIALTIWRHAREPLEALTTHANGPSGAWASFRQGLIVQISNPKTAIVIAGIFAAFVPQEPPAYTVPLVAVVAYVIDFLWYAVVAITLSGASSRALYQRAKPYFDRGAALFLVLVALRLMISPIPG